MPFMRFMFVLAEHMFLCLAVQTMNRCSAYRQLVYMEATFVALVLATL